MAKHLPNTVWSLRWHPKKVPNGVVRTMNKSTIGIHVSNATNDNTFIVTDRRTARLLARRILQCLEDTK